MDRDQFYMRRCLQLARRGAGYVSPNPMVGAVVVCQDRIIGEGYHRCCGEAHAEVNAIGAVQDERLLSRSNPVRLFGTLCSLRENTSVCRVDYPKKNSARRGGVSRSV